MDLNYAELYGVRLNESDFNGAIERALKNNTRHLGGKIYRNAYRNMYGKAPNKSEKKKN